MDIETLDIKQLDAFAAVMSTGSITNAARLLGRSQSTMSRAIQDLETNLGFPLLYRNGPRIFPTDQGVQFHAEVERFLMGLNHIKERAEAIALSEVSPIDIAAIPAICASLVPQALVRMTDGDVVPRKIQIHSMLAESVVQAVSSRNSDFGVSSLPIDNPGVDIQWIGEAACVAALPANAPLAKRKKVRLLDLQHHHLIATANPFRLRPRINAAFRAAGLSADSMIDTNASVTALAAVRAGLGVAVIDPVSAWGLPIEGVVIRPLDIDIPFYFGAISSGGRPLSPLLARLSDALRETAAAMLPDFMEHPLSRLEEIMRRQFDPDACSGTNVTL
ncbi:LysR family transcriptional regulator [Komagataeibacter xylinus]|uniref:LysR family transcriptional regulator n=1 Tax=Komagataeibacter xylinus TaxID=28448 RepID=UPI00280A911B|nr:LysR family transcriptional regulator [Komagataeibacter xylinus]